MIENTPIPITTFRSGCIAISRLLGPAVTLQTFDNIDSKILARRTRVVNGFLRRLAYIVVRLDAADEILRVVDIDVTLGD